MVVDQRKLDEARRALGTATDADTVDRALDMAAFRRERSRGKEDWLAVLKACPVSMDDVPPRRRETARKRRL